MKTEPPFFPGFKNTFEELLESLRGKKVAVIGHMRPDGDCIGSMVGLTRALNASSYAIDAIAMNRDPTPENLKGFIGDTPYYLLEDADLEGRQAISVDCADDRRMSDTLREQFESIFCNIDHHISNPEYGKYNLVDGKASATAEVLAGLFLDGNLPIDATTAQALYVGMATDTGQFRFASTTPQVFEICCQLCGKGAEPSAAAFELYENESFEKLLLLQRFLASLQLHFKGRVCIGRLLKKDFEETGATSDDTEGLVDYARSIDGVDIGALIEERGDGIKCSLRAKEGKFQVQQIAQQFGGGGHACAAGLNVELDAESFQTQLVEALDSHLESLKVD